MWMLIVVYLLAGIPTLITKDFSTERECWLAHASTGIGLVLAGHKVIDGACIKYEKDA